MRCTKCESEEIVVVSYDDEGWICACQCCGRHFYGIQDDMVGALNSSPPKHVMENAE